jgi:hypothetical protein
MATPVLGPETRAENKKSKVDLTRIEKERLERLKKLNPEVPKERTLMEKLVDQLRKSLTGKNLPKDVALAERRLQAGKYGSMDADTYDPASMRKKPERKVNTSRTPSVSMDMPKNVTSVVMDMPPPPKRNKKLGNVNVPRKPKTIETSNIDKLKSIQEAKERSSVKPTKKKRDRLFGLDFLPEIDSKEGGDKINLPFGLGSYETLPIEDDLVSSRNKKGGRINRKAGGKVRKAGCKRGMGKAMRGY